MDRLDDIVVESVREAFTVFSEKGRYLEVNKRPYWGLSFCYGGAIVYTHREKRILSDQRCAVLLPRGASYRLEGIRVGNFPVINFMCDAPVPGEFLQIPLSRNEDYLRDYELLKEELLLSNRLRVMELFYGILHRLSQEKQGTEDAMGLAVAYIQTHYACAQLSTALVADAVGISEVYLRQLFRERMRTSPKQYVLKLRMQKACQLLGEGRLSVGEIAIACGFTAIYHFSAAFRAFTGQTPTAYRRAHCHTHL